MAAVCDARNGGGSEQTTLNGRKVEQHIIWAGRIGRDTKVLAADNVTKITSWTTPDDNDGDFYRFDINMAVNLLHADGSDFTLGELSPYAQGACDPSDRVHPEVRPVAPYMGQLGAGSVGNSSSMWMDVTKFELSGENFINRFSDGLRVYLDATVAIYRPQFDAYAAAYEGFGQDHPGIVAQAIHDGLSPDNPELGIVVSTWSVTDADA